MRRDSTLQGNRSGPEQWRVAQGPRVALLGAKEAQKAKRPKEPRPWAQKQKGFEWRKLGLFIFFPL